MGKTGVEIACDLAVCCFNDGASSLAAITDTLHLNPTALSKAFLKRKDIKRLGSSEYNEAKKLRRLARRRRKGLDDRHEQGEGVVSQREPLMLVSQGLARDLGVENSDFWFILVGYSPPFASPPLCVASLYHYITFAFSRKLVNLHYDIFSFLFSHTYTISYCIPLDLSQ